MREQCTDPMSGELFPFRVRVDVKRTADMDTTNFEGCGRYVMDYRLNDIWVLTRFGDRILETDDFVKGLPGIEFHLKDNRVVGSTGCNRITGRFEARGDKITLRYLVTTRMACPDMAFEQEFLSALSDKTLRYTINDGRLILTDDKEIMIELGKTD